MIYIVFMYSPTEACWEILELDLELELESNPDSEVGVFAGEGPERDLLALLRNDVIPTERPAKTRGSVFLPRHEEPAAAAHLS